MAGHRLSSELPNNHDRREEILDAATELFAAHGYSDTVTQLLADRLEVGKGTIYRYFPSKRDLFLAAVDRVMRRLQERVRTNAQGIDDLLDRVQTWAQTCLDYAAEHPEYIELLIQERAQFKDREKPTYFAARELQIERWRDMYRDLIAEGRLRDVPVERITDVIFAAVYGAMFLEFFTGRTGAFAARPDDIVDILFFGILSDRERQVFTARKRGEAPNGAVPQEEIECPRTDHSSSNLSSEDVPEVKPR